MNTCSSGYAVCFHGYYRNTADIDFWIATNQENAGKLVILMREFGFDMPEISENLFLQKGRMIRMGTEPTRIELLTEISGCNFEECYTNRIQAILDDVPVNIISRSDLIKNKIKSGRLKDMDDVQKLS